jgi:hypothetical protein
MLRGAPLSGRNAWIIVCAVILVALGVPMSAAAQTKTLTLAWDGSPQAIDHYNVYIGSKAGLHDLATQSVPGIQPAYSFTVSPGTLLFFAVSAVTADGLESPLSAELKCAVPTLAQPANQAGTAGVAITPLALSASDPGGGQLQFSASGLPAGLSINGATGVISGIPTTVSTKTVTVSVNNGSVATQQTFTWTIAAAPVISAVINLSVNPSSGTGTSGTFTAQYSDSLGTADLTTVYLKFGTSSTATASTCSMSYNPATNLLALQDDSGTTWQSALLGSGTVQNSQCTVNLAASSESTNGQVLSLALSLTFNSAYAGAKNIYSYATPINGVSTGWKTVGTWSIPAPAAIPALSTISVTPQDGFGAVQTFAAKFMAASGATNIATAFVKFSVAANGAVNTCIVRYERASGMLSLRDDAAVWQPGSVAGGPDVQRNTQCRLFLAGSSISASGQVLTMNVAMKFSPLYAGEKKVYLDATSVSGTTVGWKEHGAWTVPADDDDTSISTGSVTPDSGFGATQVFAARYYDAENGDQVSRAFLKFSTAANSPVNTCLIAYDKVTQLLSLRDDTGQWPVGLPMSLAGSQENSQCSVSMAQSSATVANSMLMLNVAVTFKPTYDGPKNIYMRATSESGLATDWQYAGSWTVPSSGPNARVSVGTVTPNVGTGSTQTFTAQFVDALGSGDLSVVYLKINGVARGAQSSCMIRYRPENGRISLRDDVAQWMPGISANAAGQLQNSQCSLSVSPGAVTISGNTLALTVTVGFKSAYKGSKSVYGQAITVDGYLTDWEQRGTWIVP